MIVSGRAGFPPAAFLYRFTENKNVKIKGYGRKID
jgi:hypothetical protein